VFYSMPGIGARHRLVSPFEGAYDLRNGPVAYGMNRDLPTGKMSFDDYLLQFVFVTHEQASAFDVMVVHAHGGGTCSYDAVGEKFERIRLPIGIVPRRQASRQGLLGV
jgi:hypothetical protein